jgi:hypothetical protein
MGEALRYKDSGNQRCISVAMLRPYKVNGFGLFSSEIDRRGLVIRPNLKIGAGG